jgi:hypothetical protein
MANEYSVAIHDYVSSQIATAEKDKKTAENNDDPASASYFEGRLQELYTIRRYLNEKIDLKTQKYY